MSLAAIVLPVILPALMDGFRGIIAKFTKGAGGQPVNMNERVLLMTAENERLKTLAELDKPAENISLWVANLRASFRYITIALIWVLAALAVFFVPKEQIDVTYQLLDIGGATLLFVIGERFYFKPR